MKKILVIAGLAVSMFATSAFAGGEQAVKALPKVKDVFIPKGPEISRPGGKGEVKINENGAVELNGKPLRGSKSANEDQLTQAVKELDKDKEDTINTGVVCRRDVMGTIPLEYHKLFVQGEANAALPRADCIAFMQDKEAIKNGSQVIAKAITVSYDLNIKNVNKATPQQAREMYAAAMQTFASVTNQPVAEAQESFGPVCIKCLALNRVICTGKANSETAN